MKKILFLGISVILVVLLVPLADWIYYRDQKFIIPPARYTGEIPIRNDIYGNGHFGASRRGGRKHNGLDIYAPLHSEVIASKGGIAKTGFVKNGVGRYVVITHTGDYVTLYGHLSEISVKDGQRIRQGTVIGYVGKTGNAKYKNIKPHLHFEIRKDGKHLDPLLFLK